MAKPVLDDEACRQIIDVVDLLEPGQRLFVVTGAGMSTESGLPTYRGTGGLYNSGKTEKGMTIEQLLSGETFRRDPGLTWKYLAEIGRACEGKKFNRGHQVLAEMETGFSSVCVLTQNIDGFHVDAGSKDVIEIHGNLHHLRCESCAFQKTVSAFSEIRIPPECNQCAAMLRPDVVLFDERLPEAACDHLSRQWCQGFDVVFSIGTTSNFPYIAEPVLHAVNQGLPAIEINPGPSMVSAVCSHRLELSASLVLDEIWCRFQQKYS